MLIVEDDLAQAQLLKEHILRSFPYVKVATSEEGEVGWEKCQNTQFDLIVLDWRLAGKLHGPGFFNRCRQAEDYRTVPIVVTSGYLKPADFALMEEFPFTSMLEKPYQPGFIIKKIQYAFKEALWFRDNEEAISQVLGGDLTNPKARLQEIYELCADCPRPFLIAMEAAKKARRMGELELALKLLSFAKSFTPGSLMLKCEFGKVFLQMGRIEEAEKILKAVHKKSPHNLERICDLGSIGLRNFDADEAQWYFNQGKKLDEEDEKVKDGLHLARNMDDFFMNSSPTSLPSSFAGLLNVIGISMVRGGKIDEGMNHYEAAMGYVDKDQDRAKLSFNLALGCLRNEKPVEALDWFRKSTGYDPDYEKAHGYVEKLEKRYDPEAAKARQAGVDVPSEAEVAASKNMVDNFFAPLTEKPEAKDTLYNDDMDIDDDDKSEDTIFDSQEDQENLPKEASLFDPDFDDDEEAS